jgi:hypothetical protein
VYTKDGESYFIVDGHVHFWDGSPANQINRYGEGFIKCFYDYHRNLSPQEYLWPLAHFERYSEEDMVHDLRYVVGRVRPRARTISLAGSGACASAMWSSTRIARSTDCSTPLGGSDPPDLPRPAIRPACTGPPVAEVAADGHLR